MDIHEKDKKDISKEKEISNKDSKSQKETSTQNPKNEETSKEEKESNDDLIPSDFEFSSRIELLIKGLNLYIYPNLKNKYQ